MNLRIIALGERSQLRENTYFMIPFIYNSRKCKLLHSDSKWIRVCLEVGDGRMDTMEGGDGKGHKKEAFGHDGYIHILIVVVS